MDKEYHREYYKKWLERNKGYHKEWRRKFRKMYMIDNDIKPRIVDTNTWASKYREKNRKKYNLYQKSYQQRHRQENKCRNSVRIALETGRMKILPCKKCGNLKAEAHHPNYNEPLNIVWLCKECHEEFHKNSNI